MPRPLIPDRRKLILDTAEALILERGFDAMSVHSIAEHVGIAKGSVYREFDSKTAILDALLTRSMERMKAQSDRLLEGQARPTLSAAYEASARVLLDDPLMTAAFLDDRGVLGSYIDTVGDDRYRRRHRAVVTWISDLQRGGAISPDIDGEALALVLSSTTLGLMQAAEHVGPVSGEQLRAALRMMADLVSHYETTGGSASRPAT